jgi:RNA polymerase sigma factor (sigma-70 family)
MPHADQFPSILGAAQAGAPWALEVLYGDLAPAVAGYLRLQGAEDPEDLTNEVFLGAFRGLGAFSGGEPEFRSWVLAIAHRRMIDERRRRARRVKTSPLDEAELHQSPGPSVEDEVLDGLQIERVCSLCAQISADQRDVILLRLVADLSVEQTATALNKRPGSVKALQRRGLEALRRVLAQEMSVEGVSK